MTFFNSIKTCYMKSFDFKGRASKSEYWWFWLFQMVLGVLTYYTLESDGHEILKDILVGCVIASTPASLSAIARRLHDVGFSLRGCLMKILVTTGILIVWLIFGARGNLVSLVISAFTFTTFIAYIMLLIVLMGDNAYGSDDEKE